MMMMQGHPYEDTDGDDSSSSDDEEEHKFYNNYNKKEEDIKPMAKKLKTGAATDGTPTKSYVVAAAAAIDGNGSPSSDDGNMKNRLLGLTEEEMAAGYFADGTEVGGFEFEV